MSRVTLPRRPFVVALGALPLLVWGMTTHSGWYGRGPAELPHLRLTLIGYWEIAITCKAWLLWCAIVVGLLLLARRRHRGLLVFGSVSIVFSILMAMRTPTGRYFLPGALGVVALVGAVRDIRPRVAAVAFTIALAIAGSAVVSDCRSHDRLIAAQGALRAEIDRAVERVRRPGDIIVFGWRTPEPSFALRFLAFEKEWIAETERLYPRRARRQTMQRSSRRRDRFRGRPALARCRQYR